MGSLWPVLLIAGSIAAFERLATGEASTSALWLIAFWMAFRVVVWVYPRRRILKRSFARAARVYGGMGVRSSE